MLVAHSILFGIITSQNSFTEDKNPLHLEVSNEVTVLELYTGEAGVFGFSPTKISRAFQKIWLNLSAYIQQRTSSYVFKVPSQPKG